MYARDPSLIIISATGIFSTPWAGSSRAGLGSGRVLARPRLLMAT